MIVIIMGAHIQKKSKISKNTSETCIFCKIVSGEAPSYKLLEDDEFLAFLSIYPNTEGVTVVIPKKHYTSYFVDQDDELISRMMKFNKKVAKLLDEKFEDVGRTAIVFEGFGVDHLHSKLFPLHGTNQDSWQPIKSKSEVFHEKYPGYVTTNDCNSKTKEDLEKTYKKLIGEKNGSL